jgi:hypothetical protein
MGQFDEFGIPKLYMRALWKQDFIREGACWNVGETTEYEGFSIFLP